MENLTETDTGFPTWQPAKRDEKAMVEDAATSPLHSPRVLIGRKGMKNDRFYVRVRQELADVVERAHEVSRERWASAEATRGVLTHAARVENQIARADFNFLRRAIRRQQSKFTPEGAKSHVKGKADEQAKEQLSTDPANPTIMDEAVSPDAVLQEWSERVKAGVKLDRGFLFGGQYFYGARKRTREPKVEAGRFAGQYVVPIVLTSDLLQAVDAFKELFQRLAGLMDALGPEAAAARASCVSILKEGVKELCGQGCHPNESMETELAIEEVFQASGPIALRRLLSNETFVSRRTDAEREQGAGRVVGDERKGGRCRITPTRIRLPNPLAGVHRGQGAWTRTYWMIWR